ncbi:outer membrane protein OmpA-like peptidoglycan-associated protein [Filimonas zeae]|uniref:OmpA family protein n=1 Tax=Filimonas zeae TaxID=1737353 RepID=A0A917IQ29_9BACT|nr:hypothetical protein [Filimonas zeae]MDR6337592.1 outer membrane protein OmpA-like peptidoglycan-associated protein [Filimonas zeae]GGH59360.1 hypothetical protein GCM10011379_06040 [Filimonas zeae]
MPLSLKFLISICLTIFPVAAAQAQITTPHSYPTGSKDAWELSVHSGYAITTGDIDARAGWGPGLAARKAINHTFSVRAGYTGSFQYGLDYRPRTTPAGSWYVANYRNAMHQGSLDIIASALTAGNYRQNSRTSLYAFAGYGIIIADIDQDVTLSGNPVSPVVFNYNRSRKAIKADLKAMMQGFHTNASIPNGNREGIGRYHNNQLLRHAVRMGAGIAFRLNSRLSLGAEQEFTLPFSDDIDGVNAGSSNDVFSYTSLRLGISSGNRLRKTAPLWWLNLNNYIYQELNVSKHMQLTPPVLPDADGDGITDLFDLEPNTPAGSKVDMRGAAMDTDGDGVPDDRDKEVLTHMMCFPVNSSGQGNCPEPPCCRDLTRGCGYDRPLHHRLCSIDTVPDIFFSKNSFTLTTQTRDQLVNLADQINACPYSIIQITGFAKPSTKAGKLNQKRIDVIIRFLSDKMGISESRLQTGHTSTGNPNKISLKDINRTR